MSTKEYGCIFCDGKSSDYYGICPKCGKPINVGDELLKNNINGYKITGVIGRGFNGWTSKAMDNLQPFAIKIIPKHRLKGSDLDREAQALANCSQPPHPNIVRFFKFSNTKLNILAEEVEVAYLIFDYIDDAKSLDVFLGENKAIINKNDVTDIIIGIASGLERMHSKGLWHYDLHGGNILIRNILDDERIGNEKYEAKLIDFGSTREFVKDEQENISRSDYSYLSKHIYFLVSKFEEDNYKKITPVDRNFSRRLRNIAQRLADPNISRRDYNPSTVKRDVSSTLNLSNIGYEFQSFEKMLNEREVSLSSPLGNTNALNLHPQDIPLLFVDYLGWQDKIKKLEPVIISGPRGCGKTMLLRYLSIQSLARPKKTEDKLEAVANRLSANEHIGFILSIGELRTPFIRASYKRLAEREEDLAEDFCREFFNAHFVYEILRTIEWLRIEKLAPIVETDLKTLVDTINGLLNLETSLKIDNHSIDNILRELDRKIVELSNMDSPFDFKPSELCGDSILVKLAKIIKTIPCLKNKDIWFLIDDYSPTVIPDLAILAFNPVLFRLSNEVRIKISSEGNGPIFKDSLGRKYKESREFTKVNLGEIYFRSKESDCCRFFEKILEARFSETKGSLNQLKRMLGEHKSDNSFGRYIKSCDTPGRAKFYGFSLLCRLCSGDVSYILELLNSITYGRWEEDIAISVDDQDERVKQFSQRQLEALKTTSDYGTKLHKFATNLGNLIKHYLLKSEENAKPDERLRIEIEGESKFTDNAKKFEDELLKHSVLIPGGSGKSRSGLPTKKYFFRRLFAPCFPFSPSRTGSIPLKVEEYNEWLDDPDSIKRYRTKTPKEIPLNLEFTRE